MNSEALWLVALLARFFSIVRFRMPSNCLVFVVCRFWFLISLGFHVFFQGVSNMLLYLLAKDDITHHHDIVVVL